jgi:hypothetical protein
MNEHEKIWPENLFDLAYISALAAKLEELANLAEAEDWNYKNTESTHLLPNLYHYIQGTYRRSAQQEKIEISSDAQFITWNTGLVTANQEPIFALFDQNKILGQQPWHFMSWCRRGQHDLVRFMRLPEMATYFDSPVSLVFDTGKEFRANVEHIIEDNKERFPPPYNAMDNFQLQTFLKGAIDNARERVRRNYKTAIPQFHRGRIQLLLPLCITSATKADLAIVAEDYGTFYRASTCLTLDMAYSNARLLARPDRDWLQP